MPSLALPVMRADGNQRVGADDPTARTYAKAAFSWILQGAAHGLDVGPQALTAVLREDPRLADAETLTEGMRIRGQDLTMEIIRLVAERNN